jgi:hypothetical protein
MSKKGATKKGDCQGTGQRCEGVWANTRRTSARRRVGQSHAGKRRSAGAGQSCRGVWGNTRRNTAARQSNRGASPNPASASKRQPRGVPCVSLRGAEEERGKSAEFGDVPLLLWREAVFRRVFPDALLEVRPVLEFCRFPIWVRRARRRTEVRKDTQGCRICCIFACNFRSSERMWRFLKRAKNASPL